MTEKTLLLVDGSSFLFRAFHALPDLRNPAGQPTGAVYGVVGMLRRLRSDSKLNGGARHGAVIFDAPGKTFRDDWYADYKATRRETPGDLVSQIPIIHAIIRASGWPLIMQSGVEADDVIGTLALRAADQGWHTIISTGDKDMAQLVGDRVVLQNTMSRDTGPVEWLDREGVRTKFGVPPERIVDYLSLIGDTVDNVPGVEKVGPKTAVKWLAQYGDLDQIIAHAADIGGVVGQNLRKALDWLPMARRLVTIRCDCELETGVEPLDEGLILGEPDQQALLSLYTEAGFRTWRRELEDRLVGAAGQGGGAQGGAAAAQADPDRGAAGAARPAAGEPDSGASAADAGVADAPSGDPESGPRPAGPTGTTSECVLSEADLAPWLSALGAAPIAAVSIAVDAADPMRAHVVGLALSVEPGRACYIPLAHHYAGVPTQLDREPTLARLKPWLEDPARPKLAHDIKHLIQVLANHDITLAGGIRDTMLASYVLEAHRNHQLAMLASRHLDRRVTTLEDVAGKGAKQLPFEQVAVEVAAPFMSESADVTLQLHELFQPRIDAEARLPAIYEDIELPTARVLQQIERNGVRVDAPLLAAQSDEIGRRLVTLELQAGEAAGRPFNLGSPKQLGELLFEELGLPVLKKTAGGSPSTDEDVLSRLAEDFPLPRIVLEHRGLSKLKGTYTDKLPRMINPDTGRVHTTYGQAVAVTGRLASNDPNLQNIPIRTPEGRRIREAFVAGPGRVILSADYSQIELRIMAHLSGDAGLRQAFADGLDVHRATAAEIFGVPLGEVSSEQRRYAKVINFGLIYGMSAFGLATNLKIERQAAKNYIERYFARYPGVARYMDETRRLAHEQGYVETVFGRRLWLAEINSPNGPRRQAAERAAINAPMQGTAADLIKLAMIAVQHWLQAHRPEALLIMQVHDELVFELPEALVPELSAKVTELMTGVGRLDVPLEVGVGVGPDWDKAH